MTKAIVLAAAIAAFASPTLAQQAGSTANLSTQQEAGAGLNTGQISPALAAGIAAGAIVLGVALAGGGSSSSGGSTSPSTSTSTSTSTSQ